MAETMDNELIEIQSEDKRAVDPMVGVDSVASEAWTESIDRKSGDHQNQYLSSQSVDYPNYVSDPKSRRRSKSRSRSPNRSRSRSPYRSRSRSQYRSRSRSPYRSRSRSPYFGPIIKDYRRGRRGFARYPRGFRDRGMRTFRRRQPYYSRHHDYSRSRSRSRSRSVSPKRRNAEIEKSDSNSGEDKTIDSKHSETLKPSDINMSEKRLTQNFLAMLEEKHSRSKMVPIDNNRRELSDNEDKPKGFVNTFNSIQKNTLSFELEREGWQLVDDANSESGHKRRGDSKSTEMSKHLGDKEVIDSEKSQKKEMDVQSSSSGNQNSKRKKSKKQKKRKRRKHSTSSDSSDSESDVDKKKKKKSKQKKSKKRKHQKSSSSSTSESSESSDSSESEDRKKKRKRKKKSKKSKKSRKLKKEKKLEKREKSKVNEEKKKPKEEEIEGVEGSECVTVLSVGEPALELQWPKKLIKYTDCEPSVAYSVNPKIKISSEDLKQMKERKQKFIEDLEKNRKNVKHFESEGQNDSIVLKTSEKLTTEYERFIDELNPISENKAITEESIVLESKLRENFMKEINTHLYDKKDSDSLEPHESVTPSERRAMEKMKKNLHSYDGYEDNRRLEDFKSAPISAYYSAKVQKSPNDRSHELNKESKQSKSHENDNYYKTGEITLSIGERSSTSTSKLESESIDNSKVDDKRTTAKELLERVKQRQHSKEGKGDYKDDSKRSKRLPQIAKIPPKKSIARTRAEANADSTQTSEPMKLDLNYDYNWYYNYYMNSMYGIAEYPQMTVPNHASAYYAQYSMVTSVDYNQTDLTNWMTERGYTFDSNAISTQHSIPKTSETSNEDPLKAQELHSCLESSAPDLNSVITSEPNNSIETIDSNIEKVDITGQTSDPKPDVNETNGQKIEVMISSSQSSQDICLDQLLANESKDETNSSDMSPFSSLQFKHKVKVRVTSNSQTDVETIDENSPPPPPPPPARPLMTTFTSSEPITLPNGQVLPAGTQQTVVHPYHTDDAHKFTSDWYYNAFNSQQNTTESNS